MIRAARSGGGGGGGGGVSENHGGPVGQAKREGCRRHWCSR